MTDPQHTAYLNAIHDLMIRVFNLAEIRDLCFQLGLSADNIPGSTRGEKTRELILLLDRTDRLDELKTLVLSLRPHVTWPAAASNTEPPSPPSLQPDRWQMAPEDIERLVRILQQQPRFATPDRRLDFLQETFAGSPRRSDILGIFDVNGPPRSVAVRLVNRLLQFGQDIPGRETVGLLIQALLADYGSHPDADFLRSLLERYPLGIQVRRESPEPQLPDFTPPPKSERFLRPEDRRWLAHAIGSLNRFQYVAGRRNLLVDAQIPDRWMGEIGLDGPGALEIAKTIINDLERRGPLPQNPQKHALGGLLEALLDSFGMDDARRDVALIVRYRLNTDRAQLNRLSERFGVPLPSFEQDAYQAEPPAPAALPAAWKREVTGDKLEALYANGRENWLDVNFLVNGARAAQSVCRLEWNKQGAGTGFLVAPDLVLTNYHVILPPECPDPIENRLRTCEVRFGATTTPEGGVSAGNRVVKLHRSEGLVAFSESDQLDYALLKLREPVEDGTRIVRAVLSDEPIYPQQYANIIQHPLGGAMKVALRYNQVVTLTPQRVYYLSDTLKGSSGAPVFDDEWYVIALHRAAGLRDEAGQVLLEANEGIPIADILQEIRPHLSGGVS